MTIIIDIKEGGLYKSMEKNDVRNAVQIIGLWMCCDTEKNEYFTYTHSHK